MTRESATETLGVVSEAWQTGFFALIGDVQIDFEPPGLRITARDEGSFGVSLRWPKPLVPGYRYHFTFTGRI